MDRDAVAALLASVASGAIAPEQALGRLAAAPYDELGHSVVDLHRGLRTGDPEVVYAAGKTPEQVRDVVRSVRTASERAVLVTRTSEAAVELLRDLGEPLVVDPGPAGATVAVGELPPGRGVVGVLSAGTSDGPVAAEAALTARVFGSEVRRVDDVGVAGLHRLIAARPVLEEADCLVVVAGMEGALPSVVGGMVGTPLVAVPTSTGYGVGAGGFAALAGMLTSCATGVVVVNVDNGFGAGAFAARVARRAGAAR